MYKISEHPILDIPQEDLHAFQFEGKTVYGQKGQTIAAALHQAGFPVHHHSLKDRNRTMECGIGKCGRCNIGDKFVCKDGPVFRFDELSELPDEY